MNSGDHPPGEVRALLSAAAKVGARRGLAIKAAGEGSSGITGGGGGGLASGICGTAMYCARFGARSHLRLVLDILRAHNHPWLFHPRSDVGSTFNLNCEMGGRTLR